MTGKKLYLFAGVAGIFSYAFFMWQMAPDSGDKAKALDMTAVSEGSVVRSSVLKVDTPSGNQDAALSAATGSNGGGGVPGVGALTTAVVSVVTSGKVVVEKKPSAVAAVAVSRLEAGGRRNAEVSQSETRIVERGQGLLATGGGQELSESLGTANLGSAGAEKAEVLRSEDAKLRAEVSEQPSISEDGTDGTTILYTEVTVRVAHTRAGVNWGMAVKIVPVSGGLLFRQDSCTVLYSGSAMKLDFALGTTGRLAFAAPSGSDGDAYGDIMQCTYDIAKSFGRKPRVEDFTVVGEEIVSEQLDSKSLDSAGFSLAILD